MSEHGTSTDAWLDRLKSELAPELEVLHMLGKGSMARVVLAREPLLNRLVAVKVPRSQLASDTVARARFEREAQSSAGIHHPNVIAIHRIGRFGEVPYIVMEYIEGRTLADLIAGGGPINPPETRRILAAVASALAAAHRKGIVHRDLRPDNVMIERSSNRVVLMDFGIAALLDTEHPNSRRLTATGVQLGNPLYMSPEQRSGKPVSVQSDVYGLGFLGHELLTGRPPPPPSLENMAVDTKASSKRRYNDGLNDLAHQDPALVKLIRRCLAITPSHRLRADEAAECLSQPVTRPTVHTDKGILSMIPGLNEFIFELRERKVARVGIAYVVCAFVFLQVVDLLVPALPRGDPEALYRIIVTLVLLGFPVALVLSWLFDITHEGIKRAEVQPAADKSARMRRLILPLIGLAVSVTAAVSVWLLLY